MRNGTKRHQHCCKSLSPFSPLFLWSNPTSMSKLQLSCTCCSVSLVRCLLTSCLFSGRPGYESSINTPQGKQESSVYNETIRLETIRWAMTEMIRHPSNGFKEVILTHFKVCARCAVVFVALHSCNFVLQMKAADILVQVSQWLKEAQNSKSCMLRFSVNDSCPCADFLFVCVLSAGFYSKLNKAVKDLKTELFKLNPELASSSNDA